MVDKYVDLGCHLMIDKNEQKNGRVGELIRSLGEIGL